MPSLPAVVLAPVVILVLALSSAEAKAERKLPHEITDTRKLYEAFPFVVAIFDQDEDGDLDCVTSTRTNIDVEANTATYVWSLQGGNGHEKRNITFNLKPGPTPDSAVYTPEDDKSKEELVSFIYTDYKDCVIVEMPFKNHLECMLWVSDEVKDNIPQLCLDMFEDICDDKISAYSRDMCDEEHDL
ncbi:uncharacterized protein LOC144158606 [Haemaphysalis longicornis]